MRLAPVHSALLALALAGSGCQHLGKAPSQGERAQAAVEVTRAWAAADSPLLAAAIDGEWRTRSFRARDSHRHPRETLEFFNVGSRSRVVEISPGAGWYSEILGPYLRNSGTYFVAMPAAAPDSAGGRRNAGLKTRFAADPARYDRVQWLEYDAAAPEFGAPGSADVVLTFRNVHNWAAADTAAAYFKAFHDVLKPGGVLGVVDHRARPGTSLETMKKSGYLTEELVIGLATAAGFRLEASSEVNANPRDTTDHPNGVWTLFPTARHPARDAARYRTIGESDRMTLRFVKP